MTVKYLSFLITFQIWQNIFFEEKVFNSLAWQDLERTKTCSTCNGILPGNKFENKKVSYLSFKHNSHILEANKKLRCCFIISGRFFHRNVTRGKRRANSWRSFLNSKQSCLESVDGYATMEDQYKWNGCFLPTYFPLILTPLWWRLHLHCWFLLVFVLEDTCNRHSPVQGSCG